MIRVLFFSIWLLNIICFIFRKNPKWLACVSFISAVVIFGGNTGTADYISYKLAYETGDFYDFELGFVLYNNIFRHFGIDFQVFYIINEFLLLATLCYLLYRVSGSFACFFSLFFVSEQFVGIAQLRMFIVSTLIAVSVFELANNRRVAAVLCNCFTAIFQWTGVFFLPFLIVYGRRFDRKKVIRFSLLVSVCFAIFAFVLNDVFNINIFANIARYIVGLFATQEKAYFYTSETTRFGVLVFFTLYFVNLAMIKYTQRRLVIDCGKEMTDYDRVILMANAYVGIALPFLVVGTVFYRLYRIINLSNFIYIASKSNESSKTSIRYWKWCFITLFSTLVWGLYYILFVPGIYRGVFENNLFIVGR